VSPLQLVQAPGERGRRFIVDQVGVIWGMNRAGDLMRRPFLDISSKITPLDPSYDERGLLGLAFHPNFSHIDRFFVFYTAPPPRSAPDRYDNTTTIAEYRASGPRQAHADASSERIILQVDHPQSNHNGGTVAFGPDGYLYISIGDGGAGDDVAFGHVEDWYARNARVAHQWERSSRLFREGLRPGPARRGLRHGVKDPWAQRHDGLGLEDQAARRQRSLSGGRAGCARQGSGFPVLRRVGSAEGPASGWTLTLQREFNEMASTDEKGDVMERERPSFCPDRPPEP
jgi:hypothetical protein